MSNSSSLPPADVTPSEETMQRILRRLAHAGTDGHFETGDSETIEIMNWVANRELDRRRNPPISSPSSAAQTIPISGVWLRRIGDDMEVWVEVAGDWYMCITEFHEGPISHIAEVRGIKSWPKMEKEND